MRTEYQIKRERRFYSIFCCMIFEMDWNHPESCKRREHVHISHAFTLSFPALAFDPQFLFRKNSIKAFKLNICIEFHLL